MKGYEITQQNWLNRNKNKELILPKLHAGQVEIFNNSTRYNAVCTGRRFGKTVLLTWLAGRCAIKGGKVAICAPQYKQLAEPWNAILDFLYAAVSNSNKTEGSIRLLSGGKIDFWALNDNELACRGREYDLVLCDEIAFSKDEQMTRIWERSIKPTMLTTKGTAWMFSTPNGVNTENFFWQICNESERGWKFHHAPSRNNPYVPMDELEKERKANHELVWLQEYEAKFISWDNATFFKLDFFLKDNNPVAFPKKCDAVFAIMDCAVKSGSENDATAVLYCAYAKYDHEYKLIWLDWDLYNIEAASLEYLAPKILNRINELSNECGARLQTPGILCEDAAGGSVLIQQSRSRGWAIQAIDTKLMSKGKDERAFIAGGPASAGLCKISEHAYNKTQEWKGRTHNHLIHQVTTFRIGDKDAAKRADDLLDCATYSIALTLADEWAI